MVKRRTPGTQAPVKKEWTLAKIERGVQKLTKRLTELNELVTGDRDAPAVAVFEAELPTRLKISSELAHEKRMLMTDSE